MKLDERFKGFPFCCFTAENCSEYINQKGYFANDIDFFKSIDLCEYGALEKVYCDEAKSFQMREKLTSFRYFIPEYFVKPKEKQFRPCTLDDFGLNIGDLIRFRRKDDHNIEVCTMYMGYMKNNGIVKVMLGNTYYSLEILFNDYEWYDRDSSTWEVFGVEE